MTTVDQTNLAWDVLVDVSGTGPLHERLTRAIRSAVADGRLPAGAALPPSRLLATTLGCSRWAVTEAYGQLVAEGVLEARTGSATRVRPAARPDPRALGRTGEAPRRVRYDLRPGLPDLRSFPRTRWSQAIREVLADTPHDGLAPVDDHGAPAARDAVAGHVARTRAVRTHGATVLLTRGTRDGFTRLARAMVARGHTRLAVEDPGWPPLRRAAGLAGLEVVPVPVDADGIRVDVLERHTDVRAVLVTPTHQFPTGGVLPADRRSALLRWADRVGGLVLEDDYDAEFRFGKPPVPSLQGRAPHAVALMGSVSKTLAPGMGLGWLVLPRSWEPVVDAVDPGGASPPVLDQLALAVMIRHGWYDRHLRTVRLRYRRRRDALTEALAQQLPGWEVSGACAGLHLLLQPPPDGPAPGVRDLVRGGRGAGLDMASLSDFAVTPLEGRDVLVLGYGNLRDRDAEPAVRALADLAGTRRDAAGTARGEVLTPRPSGSRPATG